jgi:signal transduction histidine kinase
LEARQNATKHAGANAHITITLEPGPGCVSFTITDDGTGFDLETQAGVGLLSMQDRVEAFGAI